MSVSESGEDFVRNKLVQYGLECLTDAFKGKGTFCLLKFNMAADRPTKLLAVFKVSIVNRLGALRSSLQKFNILL